MAVVLLTGCSSGIGLSTSVELARGGDRVFASMRNLNKADRLQQACVDAGVSVDVVELDVTDQRSIEAAVDQVVSQAGRIDVLVNNAAIGFVGSVEEMEDADSKALFETNYFGPLRVIRAVIPVMRSGGGGLIVNISSLSSILYSPGTCDYAASKAALEVMSMTLHLELRGDGIKVTTVPLAGFKTSFWENLSVARNANETTRALWTNAEAAADQSLPRGDPAEAAGGIADVIHAETHSVRRYIGGSGAVVQMWKTMPDDDYVAMIGQWADQLAAAQPTT